MIPQKRTRHLKRDLLDRCAPLMACLVVVASGLFSLYLIANRETSSRPTITFSPVEDAYDADASPASAHKSAGDSRLLGEWIWMAPSEEDVALFKHAGAEHMLWTLRRNAGTRLVFTEAHCDVTKTNDDKSTRCAYQLVTSNPELGPVIVLGSTTFPKSGIYRIQISDNSLQLTKIIASESGSPLSSEIKVGGRFGRRNDHQGVALR